jgi:hypothetical protein
VHGNKKTHPFQEGVLRLKISLKFLVILLLSGGKILHIGMCKKFTPAEEPNYQKNSRGF